MLPAQSGLSRPALPPPRLRPCVRRLARRTRREIRLPRHGRTSGARTRTCLRGRTRCCAASRPRRRRPAGSQGADRTLPPEGHGTAGRHRHAALARHLRPDRRDRGRSRMNATVKIDAACVELRLSELRLPGIKLIWAALAETADKEGWPAARFLAALAEQEMVERSRRRFGRHLEEGSLPPGKTLDAFDFDAVPMISKAQVQALAAGDAWLEKGANLLCFGPPGGGKSHLAAALGMALIEKGWRVLFTRTTDLVQKLQIARRDLALEAAIAKLDKYHLLILDDLAYVTKDQAETSVLFELISARYERRSMLITANQPFGEWGKIFPDQAMTLAAIDRLVHHSTSLERNVDSYRRKAAVDGCSRWTPGGEEGEIAIGDMTTDQQTARPQSLICGVEFFALEIGQFEITPIMQPRSFGSGPCRQAFPVGRAPGPGDARGVAGDRSPLAPGLKHMSAANPEYIAFACLA